MAMGLEATCKSPKNPLSTQGLEMPSPRSHNAPWLPALTTACTKHKPNKVTVISTRKDALEE